MPLHYPSLDCCSLKQIQAKQTSLFGLSSRYIKMSSPNINNAIIVGCILAYVSVVLFSVDGERLTSFICKVTISVLLQNIFVFPRIKH